LQVVTDRFHPVEAPYPDGSFYDSGSDGTIARDDPSRDPLIVFLTQSRGGDVTQRFVRLVYDAVVRSRSEPPRSWISDGSAVRCAGRRGLPGAPLHIRRSRVRAPALP
jgi:hypothetical protein